MDFSGYNCKMFHLNYIALPKLKYENRGSKTYTIDGVERSYEISEDYRDLSISNK